MSLVSYRFRMPRRALLSCSLAGWIVILLGFSLISGHAWAQEDPGKEPERKSEDADLPKPKDIDLETDDGLEMKATFFPGTKGAESIPVIILHGFKGNRKDFAQEDGGLARFLQEKLGCAVIMPDLRGHGDSIKLHVNKKRTEDLKGKRLPPAQIAAMVTKDLGAVKDYLWEKNNQKALNLNKLTVIGVEEGAALALSYAAYDAVGYDLGTPSYGPLKLGGFVRAEVLISPVTNIPALKTSYVKQMMPAIFRDLSVMIAAGNKSKEFFQESERLSNQFVKSRPVADDNKLESKTVWFFRKIETPLQGTKLLDEPSLRLPEKVVEFMKKRLIVNPDAKEWTWKERKKPHE
jgi:pimeloyl-ACP methyl ester carboxylesterase